MVDARIRFDGAAGAATEAAPPFSLDVHLQAAPGITAIYGISGSGKTVLFDLLAGIAQPAKGRILVDDQILFDAGTGVNQPTAKRQIGYVFQHNCLLPHLTLKENLQFAAAYLPAREGIRKVMESLEQFGLGDVSGSLPAALSPVEHRVGMLAQAVLRAPRALLVDTIPLDWEALLRARFLEVLRTLAAELRIPIVLATRHLDDCFEAAQAMLVLHQGKFLQGGTPGEVCRKPASLIVAELLGQDLLIPAEIVFLDPQNKLSRLKVFGAEVPGPYFAGRFKGNRLTLCVPPDAVRCLPRNGEAVMPGHAPLTLRRAVARPYDVRLYFEEGISVDLPQASQPSLQPGYRWQVAIPETAMRVL